MAQTDLRSPAGHLALPFFDDAHRQLADGLRTWAPAQQVDESDDRAACRDWVRRLGDGGWLRYCVAAEHGGALPALDSRALVVLRETLAFHSPLADFALAMQGLGSGAISLAGTPAQQAAYLPAVARGDKIAAFALSEPEAGSDVAAMQTIASRGHPTMGSGPFHPENGQKRPPRRAREPENRRLWPPTVAAPRPEGPVPSEPSAAARLPSDATGLSGRRRCRAAQW